MPQPFGICFIAYVTPHFQKAQISQLQVLAQLLLFQKLTQLALAGVDLTALKKTLHATERDTERVQQLRVEYWHEIGEVKLADERVCR